MKKHIDFIDVAKGLAIIAVVMSHAITNSTDSFSVSHPVLLNWISLFNVPVFFFINGFLYNESYSKTPIKSIIKKAKAYYIPYVSYNLFFLLTYNISIDMHLLNSSASKLNAKTFFLELLRVLCSKLESFGGPLWFLRALIVVTTLYILVDSLSSQLFNGQFRYLINAIFAVFLYLLNYFGYASHTFNINAGCSAMIVFFAGVMFKHINLAELTQKYAIPLSCITFMITIIIANTSYVGIVKHLNPALDIFAKITSIIMVICISQIPSFTGFAPLKKLGQSSMEIMALHILAFKPVSLLIIYLYKLDISMLADNPVVKSALVTITWSIVYTTFGLLLPYLLFYCKAYCKNNLKQQK